MATPRKKKQKTNNATLQQTTPECVFCGRAEDDVFKYGEILTNNRAKLSVHYYCLILSSGLWQKGKEKQGFYGFLFKDVQKEARRSAEMTCIVCKIKGASIRCSNKNCEKNFHFPCGQEKKFLFQYFDRYESFCPSHRPVQKDALQDGSSQCSICLEQLKHAPSYGVIKSPCCKQTWFHRICLQRQALNAGKYFFKCAICNNKKSFQNEMLRMGIHVPQRDAAWELEENAFSELHEVPQRCDVENCLCDMGRNHHEARSGWCIICCHYCGSMGTHIVCSSLSNVQCKWTCPECLSILQTSRNEEDLVKSKETVKPTTTGLKSLNQSKQQIERSNNLETSTSMAESKEKTTSLRGCKNVTTRRRKLDHTKTKNVQEKQQD